MRVTVCEINRTGKRHGMRYRRDGYIFRCYACGLVECVGYGGLDTLIGHYTDWRERVTCKTCLRALARMEEAAKSDGQA